jgi:hypothetical protein
MNRRNLLIGGGAVLAASGGAAYLAARSMGSAADYRAGIAAARAPLPDPAQFADLVRYATLAPNGHNTQPWSFSADGDVVRIRPDPVRRTPVVDPDDHHVFVSLGCAAENLALAAAARGRPGLVGFDPAGAGTVTFTARTAPAMASPLFEAIPRSQSTRADYDGRAVSAADLRILEAAGSVPGVDLVLLTGRPALDRLRHLVIAGNDRQMADPAFVAELKAWLRFNPRQALASADGLYSMASGRPPLPGWIGLRAFDWLATPKSESDRYARQLRSTPGIAVFAGAREDRAHWVAVGQACQRFALQATALGLKHAFVNQPVEVADLRPDLAALVGLPGRRPDIVLRFGYGPSLPYSARRPAGSVIVAGAGFASAG